MSHRTTRRQFLARSTAAVLGAPLIARSGLLSDDAPSEKITLGMIGVGGHGVNRNLKRLLGEKAARVVAVCDVFRDRRERARAMVDEKYSSNGTRSVNDFREILGRRDIDAVMISTPDHWHVLQSVLAMRQGKDVICEKPTLTIAEGRLLADTVKKHRAVFQTSTEDRSLPVYHQMAQIVRNGLLGKIERVEVELPAGQNFPAEEPVPVPTGLDWDLWLGPAPWREYTPEVTEKQHWRHVFDFSGGKFSDWGMHQVDTVQWALDRERSGPVKVAGKGTINPGSPYDTFVQYELDYEYEDGAKLHIKSGGTSLRFIGEKGWVGNARFAAKLEASSPEILAFEPSDRDIRLRTNYAGEHRDFLEAVKERRDPYFPAEIGHRCATVMHLGNIAMRLGRPLRWDPKTEAFEKDAEADAMRGRALRAPWTFA